MRARAVLVSVEPATYPPAVAPIALTMLTSTECIDSPFVAPPLYPLLDWFTDEAADAAPPKMTLYPDGRVAGVVAPAGRCLLDGTRDCWMVPRPADGRGSSLYRDGGGAEEYAMAMVGSTWCDLGWGEYVEIPSACLAGPGGHADGWANLKETRAHYDDTDFQVARGRYVWSDIAGGVVFIGGMWPDLTERQIAVARASACSIDYRWIEDEDDYRLIATCLVNVGGLPSRYGSIGVALAAGETVLITDQDAADIVAEAESITERAAVVSALGLAPLLGPPEVDESGPTLTAMKPRTVDQSQAAPAADQQHSHTAAPGGTCSCGQQVAAAVEADHPSVIAASGEVTPAAVAAVAETPAEEVASRRAAYILVEDAVPDWGDEITWAGGVGMCCGTFDLIDGSSVILVYPQVGGEIDFYTTVGIPAADATVTGREYDWLDPWDWDLDGVVLEPATEGTASSVAAATASLRVIEVAGWERREDGPDRRAAGLAVRLATATEPIPSPVARTPEQWEIARVKTASAAREAATQASLASLQRHIVRKELADL